MESIVIDGVKFEIRRSSRRKTFGLSADPNGKLILATPPTFPRSALETFARKKKYWFDEILRKRLERLRRRLDIAYSEIVVRNLGRRLSSSAKSSRRLSFDPKLMAQPARIIEFVAARELLHLEQPRETGAFWRRIAGVMPDYQTRMEALS